VMQDIFVFTQTGVADGRVQGHFTATGVRPAFMDKLSAMGIELPPDIFTVSEGAERRRVTRGSGGLLGGVWG